MGSFSREDVNQKYECIPSRSVIVQTRVIGWNFSWSPEPLRKVFQLILSIAFGVGQHRQKSRTRFPGDFAIRIEVPHGVAASFVLPQDLRYELTFGETNVIQFYLVVGDIDPEPESLVYVQFHARLAVTEEWIVAFNEN
jgi:hypothetical protein